MRGWLSWGLVGRLVGWFVSGSLYVRASDNRAVVVLERARMKR